MLTFFSLVLLLVAILTAYNFYSVTTMNNNAKQVKEVELPIMIAYQDLVSSFHSKIGAARGYGITGEDMYREIFNQETHG